MLNLLFVLAGGVGFEPTLAESESAVLPLDDPPSHRQTRELQILSPQTLTEIIT